MKSIPKNSVRVIKISKQALFEFIYEKFMEEQGEFLDVEPLEVADTFAINFERGEFIFCAHKAEDENGNLRKLPDEIDLQKVMANIPDTTSSMCSPARYKEYTIKELLELSK